MTVSSKTTTLIETVGAVYDLDVERSTHGPLSTGWRMMPPLLEEMLTGALTTVAPVSSSVTTGLSAGGLLSLPTGVYGLPLLPSSS